MDEVKRGGVGPPGSLGDLFNDLFRVPRVRASVLATFRGHNVGGWEKAFIIGRVPGPVYHYDMNTAYRWASEQGLPDMGTAYHSRDINESVGIWLVNDVGPLPYSPGRGQKVITSEERDELGLTLRPSQVVGGLGFRQSVSLTGIWRELERRFPYCVKRVARYFWGRWLSAAAPEQISWAGGVRDLRSPKVRPLTPMGYNPVWAAFITSRVKLRLVPYLSGACHVFVDSLLTVDGSIPCHAGVGGFRLVDVYPKGVWIRGVGQWGAGRNFIKHAGIAQNGVDLFKYLPVS